MSQENQKEDFMIRFLEEKFNGVYQRFDDMSSKYNSEISDIKSDIHEIKGEQKRQNDKIIWASGVFAVVVFLASGFVYYFKTLNKQQIIEAIQPLQEQIADTKNTAEKAQSTANSTDLTLRSIIRNYDINVKNN